MDVRPAGTHLTPILVHFHRGLNTKHSHSEAGLIQSQSQGLLPELSAWFEVGGIASSLCSRVFLLQPISI